MKFLKQLIIAKLIERLERLLPTAEGERELEGPVAAIEDTAEGHLYVHIDVDDDDGVTRRRVLMPSHALPFLEEHKVDGGRVVIGVVTEPVAVGFGNSIHR